MKFVLKSDWLYSHKYKECLIISLMCGDHCGSTRNRNQKFKENWSYYDLDDGTVLKIKTILISVYDAGKAPQ